jgi:rubrerythrin
LRRFAMKWHCKECGRFSLRLNKEEECPECARKEEELKSYFTKLYFVAPSCAKLIPAT